MRCQRTCDRLWRTGFAWSNKVQACVNGYSYLTTVPGIKLSNPGLIRKVYYTELARNAYTGIPKSHHQEILSGLWGEFNSSLAEARSGEVRSIELRFSLGLGLSSVGFVKAGLVDTWSTSYFVDIQMLNLPWTCFRGSNPSHPRAADGVEYSHPECLPQHSCRDKRPTVNGPESLMPDAPVSSIVR